LLKLLTSNKKALPLFYQSHTIKANTMTMPKNFDIRVSLNEVRHIFQVAGRLFGDIMISAVWSVEDCTLTAYHQDEEIETLKGMDALNAAKKVFSGDRDIVVAVYLQDGEDRKLLRSSADQMPRGESVSWTALFMKATEGPGWYAVPTKYASDAVDGRQMDAAKVFYSKDAVEGRNFGGRSILQEECVLDWI
jgi:hypothetical protein